MEAPAPVQIRVGTHVNKKSPDLFRVLFILLEAPPLGFEHSVLAEENIYWLGQKSFLGGGVSFLGFFG